ncbi:sensor histidine kinase [Oceanicella actignis]|uniref:histidine kinase n=1 Tax=Oceanicella actignis TaxID=1189325 RepID=A0A1M7TAY4_9RHOB|nr:sensor histidine kinase [Oceanicella actignis]SET52860.1 His Kinase A (phospho-acceptor) domain-containing protein [Oceanicella actignis]SHN67846.1 Na+/proline symporter [Oceanicella actignis]
MTLSADLVLGVALGYVAVLFAVAFWGDRRTRAGRGRWLQSPLIYTLSISVYCTSWTFYGAVGSAARNGLEFLTIYLGPALVFVGWRTLLRKLVRIGRTQRITSIADLLSSRYGKSPALAVLVTVIAVMAATPYIALQLKAVTASFQLIGGPDRTGGLATAFWAAAGMAAFTILFGTRNVDANERHHGVVAAIAVEALVKLFALLAVGVWVTWGLMGGAQPVFAALTPEMLRAPEVFDARWTAITLLSAAAVICLPRQFQVTVVENTDERHLSTAAWLFPLYLLLICLFALPIAAAGLAHAPPGSDTDMFVLTLPMAHGQEALAMLAFLGGFSSATSMVIVASIALSTMVSNHVITPLALRASADGLQSSGDVRRLLLTSRRFSIVGIIGLGFLYHTLTEGAGALFSIGLIAFVGVAQFLPPLIGGLYWRQATGLGAICGLTAGAAVWAYALALPSFGGSALMPAEVIADGPFGIALLRPQALFGLSGMDPIVHATFWSLSLNAGLLVAVSLARDPKPLEWLQSALFVDVFRAGGGDAAERFVRRSAASEDLFVLASRILGADPARRLFDEAARQQGRASGLPEADDAFIARLERELAGSVGAASAHAMVSQATGAETISLSELMKIADETAQIMEYSAALERKSAELERAAAQLREANEQLRRLDAQKDDFLSQVSHELRTPMTAVRSFAEILLDSPDLDAAQVRRFIGIIHEESLRLTRLLDQILELSVLERGEMRLRLGPTDVMAAARRAAETALGVARGARARIEFAPLPEGLPEPLIVRAEPDRLAQVFLNLFSNAMKYSDRDEPRIVVSARREGGQAVISVRDDGPGVAPEDRARIFRKFSRGWDRTDSGGAGLGLAISREIMRMFGGDLSLAPGAGRGACFEVRLPLEAAGADRADGPPQDGPPQDGASQDGAPAGG